MQPFLKTAPEPVLKHPFIGRSASAADNAGVLKLHPLLGAAACVAALLTWPASARADSDARDHERARAAVQAGEVMPLPQLLQKLQRSHPGQVLELELEREHGRWVYEVKLLQPKGQLLKLAVDAATGEVLAVQKKAERRPERDRERKPLAPDQPTR